MRKTHSRAMTALGLLAMLGTEPAFAAQEQQGSDAAGIGNDAIIVTARRREERLQDVPVAVTVLSGSALQAQNMQSMTEFQRNVPSLTITPVNARGTGVAVQIRGQRQPELGVAADPAVAVYVNEVNAARPAGLDTALFDLESIQVLKGPQGTLFGRNSTGGALLVATRRPGPEYGGYVRGYLEDPSAAGVEGAINLPFSDAVRVRLAGNYQWREGYSKVVNTGQRLDNRNRYALRGTLDILPSDTFRSTFVVDYFKADENGVATYAFNYRTGLIGTTPQTTAAAANAVAARIAATGYPAAYAEALGLGFHKTKLSALGLSETETFAVSNTTTWDISDTLTLKNVAGYRYLSTHDISDQDGTAIDIIHNNAFVGGRQYSEELQLQGKSFEDALEWIIGGFWFRETGFDDVHTYTFKEPLVGSYSNNNFKAINRSISAFANATYTLPFENRTRIFGGVRYTWDKRTIFFRNRTVSDAGDITCTVAGAANPPCSERADAKFNKATWLAGIDHEIARGAMGYFTVSTGYRSGGFNGRATSLATQAPFKPENVTNYELGFKSNFELGGAPVMFNAAGYISKYKDIQRSLVVNFAPPGATPVTGTSVTNAASATVKGVEAEFSVRPSPDFEVTGRYSHIRARYDEFELFNPNLGANVDVSDYRFFGVSPNQWGVTAAWTFLRDGGVGDFKLSADLSYADGFPLNDLNILGARSDDNTVVNTSLAWENVLGSRATASLYVKNLFNEKYILSGLMLTASLDVASVYHSAPRVIGLSLKVPFGGE